MGLRSRLSTALLDVALKGLPDGAYPPSQLSKVRKYENFDSKIPCKDDDVIEVHSLILASQMVLLSFLFLNILYLINYNIIQENNFGIECKQNGVHWQHDGQSYEREELQELLYCRLPDQVGRSHRFVSLQREDTLEFPTANDVIIVTQMYDIPELFTQAMRRIKLEDIWMSIMLSTHGGR